MAESAASELFEVFSERQRQAEISTTSGGGSSVAPLGRASKSTLLNRSEQYGADPTCFHLRSHLKLISTNRPLASG